uniref:J domain-containing protein n=1 Tax=Rhabditophanes sp. KR3021 TaxID=114890 RepID=A0AC35UDC7_9BILA
MLRLSKLGSIHGRSVISTRSAKCWKCDHEAADAVFCPMCSVIQKPSEEKSPFQRLDIPVSYSINDKKVKNNFRKLQSLVHPDKFGSKSKEEKYFSDKHSALLNDAFKTLNDPLTRGEYMLGTHNIKEDDTNNDPMLLMEMMELNEEIDCIKDEKELFTKKDELLKIKEDLVVEIEAAFKAGNIQAAKVLLIKLKFLTSAALHIIKKLGLE